MGYDDDPDWYPVSDLKYALHKVRDFRTKNPAKPGLLKQLDEWIRFWEAGDETYDHKDWRWTSKRGRSENTMAHWRTVYTRSCEEAALKE